MAGKFSSKTLNCGLISVLRHEENDIIRPATLLSRINGAGHKCGFG